MRRFAWLLCLLAAGAQAQSSGFCEQPKAPDPVTQDLQLRFAALVQKQLESSGADVALVAREGLNLSLLGYRYSHAAVALRDAALAPWAVRELYFSCDARRPRLFDEGLASFILGMHAAEHGRVAIVLLPGDAGHALADAARDDRRALSVLGADYSANAYAFGQRFQNCNQWLAELMALAWSPAAPRDRFAAQAWLRSAGYQPSPVHAGLLMFAGWFSPWIHDGDHPRADLAAGIYRISLPASLEAFAQQQVPGASRIELCHEGERVVIHRGWTPLGAACEAGPGDQQLSLDQSAAASR